MVTNALTLLDAGRVVLLREMLKVSPFRQVFVTRSYRLLAFFTFSFLFNLILALKIPLWALLIGPLTLGVPHLLASLRYVPRFTQAFSSRPPVMLYSGFGALFILMASLRLWLSYHPWLLLYRFPHAPEMLAAVGVCLFFVFYSKPLSGHALSAFLLLSTLFLASWRRPFETAGILILLHNFVGFVYWARRAGSARDRWAALLCLGMTVLATFAILAGVFDPILMDRPTGILDGVLNDLSVGSLVFPGASIAMWTRAVSAYAFGQGVHYFVWLKAIPEQELAEEPPISFKKSARLLKEDVGGKLTVLCAAGTVVIAGLGIFLTFPEARVAYLAVAAFHGFFEIAGLAFIRPRAAA